MGSLTMSRVSAAAQVKCLSVFFLIVNIYNHAQVKQSMLIVASCHDISYIISHQVKLTAKHLDSVVIEDSTFQVFFLEIKQNRRLRSDYEENFNDKDDDTTSRFFPGLVFSSTTPHQYWSQGIDDYS